MGFHSPPLKGELNLITCLYQMKHRKGKSVTLHGRIWQTPPQLRDRSFAFLYYFYSVITLSGKKKHTSILDNFTVRSNQHFYCCQKIPQSTLLEFTERLYTVRVIPFPRGLKKIAIKISHACINTHT